MNFFTSVKLVNNTIVSTKFEHEYDLPSALLSLKFLLQDAGISRIPPDCKLPHQHYRNPDIHDDLTPRMYVVLEKYTVQDNYIELYIREDNNGYMVGYESVKTTNEYYGGIPGTRTSHERSIFELKPDGRLHIAAMKYLNAKGLEDLTEARVKYDKQNATIAEFLNSL